MVNREGDGLGDIEIRLKYGYLRYQQPKFGPLTDAFVEFGVVHRPWVDFEQTINHYRVQGSMYLERNRLLRSADYGMMVGGQFGGKVDTSYQKRVNKKNPGKYGSLAVGIYNGGGYEAVENNNNKLVEGRLSLRPFPEAATGFQVSLFGAYGKGNTAEAPDFSLGGAYLSYESPAAVLAATVFQGVGDLLGTAVDSLGNSLDKTGYSLFADVRLIHKRWRAFGRLDNLTTDRPEGEISQDRYIAGLAFAFLKSSKFVLDFEYTPDNVSNTNDKSVLELALEVNF